MLALTPPPSYHPPSWLLVLLVLTSLPVVTPSCPSNSGATDSLEDVIAGRCVSYLTVFNPEVTCNLQPRLNCSAIGSKFVTSFAGLPTCNVSQNRWDDFLANTRHEIPVDKSIFWHGTYTIVQKYSEGGKRKIPLESTLTGYLIDSLRFCAVETGGIGAPDTEFCPTYKQTVNCTWNAEASFWSAASRNFASRARGTITIMLNASYSEAYSTTSYLGIWEMPNLPAGVVAKADIWVVSYPGDVIREDCDGATVAILKNLLSGKNIQTSCTMNPRDVLWLMCWDRQDHPECMALATSGAQTKNFFLWTFLMCLILQYHA